MHLGPKEWPRTHWRLANARPPLPSTAATIGVELQSGKTKGTFEGMVETADKMLHRTSHRVAGYGEEAFEDSEPRGDFQLMVYQDGKALSITHGKTKLDPAKYEAFVRKAISRM